MTAHPMDVNTNTRVRWVALRSLPQLAALEGKRVLDVGSGLGFFSVRFSERGARVLAVDVDRESLRYLAANHGIPTQVVDVEREPLPGGPFDVVFVGEILEHLREPSALLADAARVVAPGGAVVVTTPALEGPLTRTSGKRLGHEHGTERHERDGFSSAELVDLCRGAGLTVVAHATCLFWAAELFMQLTKLASLGRKGAYRGQSDVVAMQRRLRYRALRAAFPVLMPLFGLEHRCATAFGLAGHCHVVVAQRASGARP
jgi:2-polyprenyl-3-methyl-5-hydroxy-6-metoxy-1,4-benzoquinol methylase